MVGVAVISYNTREHLRACLESVPLSEVREVVVVDNASRDGSPEMVSDEFPWVTLVANEQNRGYGAAANQAVAGSAAETLLLLNGDTRLEPGALPSLVAYLEDHPEAAVVAPRLVNADGSLQPSCYPFPGTLEWLFDNDVVGRVVKRMSIPSQNLLRTWDHAHARAVPWVKGAALAVRRGAFETVGGFDERFFLYYEETDLCYRMWTVGWEVHFAPTATVMHIGGASTAQHRTAMNVQLLESVDEFYRHHYSYPRRLLLAAIWKGILTSRLLRDRARLVTARDERARLAIAADVAAWECALLGRKPSWDRPA